jgi:hypothetical protein
MGALLPARPVPVAIEQRPKVMQLQEMLRGLPRISGAIADLGFLCVDLMDFERPRSLARKLRPGFSSWPIAQDKCHVPDNHQVSYIARREKAIRRQLSRSRV